MGDGHTVNVMRQLRFIKLCSVAMLMWCGLSTTVLAQVSAQTAPLPGLLDYQPPRFPTEAAGIALGDGEVVMVITVAADGSVEDHVTLHASDPVFVAAVTRVMQHWRFAAVPSATTPRRELMQFDFKRSGVVTTLTHAEGARDGFGSAALTALHSRALHELDEEPRRLAGSMPKLPRDWLAARGTRPLSVNFVIDRDGQVRVPVMPAEEQPELVQRVLETVRQWRYSPPLYRGQPVAVEMTRVLR